MPDASVTQPSQGELNRRSYSNVEKLALTTTSANLVSALTKGQVYILQADVPWHFTIGDSAGAVTATTTHFELGAYQPLEVYAVSTRDKVAAILTSGTGNLYVLKVL